MAVSPERFRVLPQRFRVFGGYWDVGEQAIVEFSASSFVDVFFVDDDNLQRLRSGIAFDRQGKMGFAKSAFTFVPPRPGHWNLVVGHLLEEEVSVTLLAGKRTVS